VIHRVGLDGTGKLAVGFQGRVNPPSWAAEGWIASHTGGRLESEREMKKN
jgi:hypothetical protein